MKKKLFCGKRVAATALCGIMLTGLTACGASNEAAMDAGYSYKTENSTAASAPQMNWGASYDMAVSEEVDYIKEDVKLQYSTSDNGVTGGNYDTNGTLKESGETATTPLSARKVIKTARLELQTLEFDEFAKSLDAKILETGAYLQYADVSGSSYSGGRQSASYTIRIPEARLNDFLAGMEGIATVTNKVLGEEDVTLNYVDTESRIKTLNVEQERLLALLEKADDLDAIIRLEERLSEVRYQLESYQTRLRTYDDKISYSTVYINVYEVKRVTEKAPETILERISKGWNDTMYDISNGAQDFIVWFVVNLPYLVFWGAVIVVAVVFLKKKGAKRKAKKLEKQSVKNETELDDKE